MLPQQPPRTSHKIKTSFGSSHRVEKCLKSLFSFAVKAYLSAHWVQNTGVRCALPWAMRVSFFVEMSQPERWVTSLLNAGPNKCLNDSVKRLLTKAATECNEVPGTF